MQTKLRALATAVGAIALAASFGSIDAADDTENLQLVHRIKTEAFDNSKVMDHVFHLTDQYGPRLTASPEFQQAADWALGYMKEIGLTNVHAESWGPFGKAWTLEHSSVEMTVPRYSQLKAVPLAWSRATNGVVTGDLFLAPAKAVSWDPEKAEKEWKEYTEKYKGKLKGKIVLLMDPKSPPPATKPGFVRYTDAELAEIANSPEPSIKRNTPISELKFPEDPEEQRKFMRALPESVFDQLWKKRQEMQKKVAQFFNDEGVVAVFREDSRAHDGLLFGEAAGPVKAEDPVAPPTFNLTAEHYLRLTRLLEKKVPTSVQIDLKVKMSEQNVNGVNLIGEIPGGKKKDEIVMIGAHFDSWHSGTGATDNGAGSGTMLEVMRVLKALDLKMDRTIRIALWSGEEQGLYGSEGYVKEHFADPKTMKVTEQHARLSGYFNLDNGSGKIRGVYLQGNDAMRPLFQQWLAPFKDLGVGTISIRNTGGTDHLSFDAVGLPGFQFIQDPLDYMSTTHHSDMDNYDHIVPEDLMQASAVITSVVYNAATRDQMLPRVPLPKPETADAETKPATK